MKASRQKEHPKMSAHFVDAVILINTLNFDRLFMCFSLPHPLSCTHIHKRRRPLIRSLYDVFSAIRDDESEHVKTINACQVSEEKIISPNAAAANAGWAEQVEEEDEEKMERRLREDWVREYDALGVGRPWDGGEEVGAEEGEEGEDHDGLGWSEEVEFP